MKGFVFTFRNNQKVFRLPDFKRSGSRLKQALSRYGLQAVFAAMFLMGLVVGAASGHSFDQETFHKLDLLFVTNIDARMKMSYFDIFLSCFVSDFLFIFCVFLSALSAWGCATIPLLSALKGFTVGLSSAFVFSLYQLSGIGFYILVVLPGTVLFLFIFIRYSAQGFLTSASYLKLSAFGNDRVPAMQMHLKRYIKKTLFTLLSIGACAVVDMVLWIVFADKFEFS